HQQVEVPPRKRPAEVCKPEQECPAKAEPDRVAVDLLATEGTAASASHLPCDLRSRPGLRYTRVLVVDTTGSDLSRGRDLAAGRSVATHVPAPDRLRDGPSPAVLL